MVNGYDWLYNLMLSNVINNGDLSPVKIIIEPTTYCDYWMVLYMILYFIK